MSKSSKTGGSRRLEAGKQKLKEKMIGIYEERDTLFAIINEFVAASESLIDEKLNENRSEIFYHNFMEINDKLHSNQNKMFMSRMNLYTNFYEDISTSTSTEDISQMTSSDFQSSLPADLDEDSTTKEPFVCAENAACSELCLSEQGATSFGSFLEEFPVHDIVKAVVESKSSATCISPLGLLADCEKKLNLAFYSSQMDQDQILTSDCGSDAREESPKSFVTSRLESPIKPRATNFEVPQLQYQQPSPEITPNAHKKQLVPTCATQSYLVPTSSPFQKVQIAQLQIEPNVNKRFLAKILRFEHPLDMYVQLQDPFYIHVQNVIREKLENIELPKDLPILYLKNNCEYVVVIEDKLRWRGKLLSIDGSIASLFNLDTSKQCTAPVNFIFPLPQDLLQYPAQAIHCELINGAHMDITPDVMKNFQGLIQGNIFPIVFVSITNRGSYHVEGYFEFNDCFVSFTEYINGLVQFSNTEPIVTMPEDSASLDTELFKEYHVQDEYRDREGSIIHNVLIESNNSSDRGSPDEKLDWDALISTIPSREIKESHSALLSFSVNPCKFYVHLVAEKSPLIDKQQGDMNVFYENYTLSKEVFKVKNVRTDSYWACKRPGDDENWYRVKIISYKEDEKVPVGGAKVIVLLFKDYFFCYS